MFLRYGSVSWRGRGEWALPITALAKRWIVLIERQLKSAYCEDGQGARQGNRIGRRAALGTLWHPVL
jgi:hypothetical protein